MLETFALITSATYDLHFVGIMISKQTHLSSLQLLSFFSFIITVNIIPTNIYLMNIRRFKEIVQRNAKLKRCCCNPDLLNRSTLI